MVDANLVSEGRIRISGIAVIATPVKGDGVLVNVPFTVQSSLNASESQITFENLKMVCLEQTPVPVKLKIIKGKKGDVNGDGDITASDAQLTFEFAISRKPQLKIKNGQQMLTVMVILQRQMRRRFLRLC